MNLRNTFFLKSALSLLVPVISILNVNAQVSISSELISSTGNYSSGGGISLSSSVGEIAVQTFFSATHFLTQGFQQPGSGGLSFTTNSLNSACVDADNGYAEVLVKSGFGPFNFEWQPGGESTSNIKKLKPGKYFITVKDARGFSLSDSVLVGLDFEGACGLHIYSGISPNGDNMNDTWVIDGINEFPKNNVYIFNRWGDRVWENDNYNNTDVVWDGRNLKNEKLPEGTYFYQVSINNKKYKGWVELTR